MRSRGCLCLCTVGLQTCLTLLAAAVEAVGEGLALLPVRVAALERVRRNEALSCSSREGGV